MKLFILPLLSAAIIQLIIGEDQPFVDGTVLESGVTYTVTAEVEPGTKSVRFIRNGAVVKTDSNVPFDFTWKTGPTGNFTFVAVPYSETGATGTQGAEVTVNFTVASAAQSPTPTQPPPEISPTPVPTVSPSPTIAPSPTPGEGIASRYPNDVGIENDPSVIFSDTFETYTTRDDMYPKWTLVGLKDNVSFVPGYQGKSMQMRLPIGTGEVVNRADKKLTREEDVIYFRVYAKWDAGYAITTSGHNGPAIRAHYPGGAQVPAPPDGTGFVLMDFDNNIGGNPRPGDTQPGWGHFYAYWPKQRNAYGDHWYPDGWVAPGGNGLWLRYPEQYPDFKVMPNWLPQRDRWYCIETMLKMNDVGRNNGEAAFWIDGELKGRFPNLFLRSIDSLKIDFFSLRQHALHSERVNLKWYDNMVVARKYIGPMAAGTSSPTPPPQTATPTATATSTPEATPPPTPTPEPSEPPLESPTPTPVPTATQTPTPEPSEPPLESPTPTPIATPIQTPTTLILQPGETIIITVPDR